MWMYLLVCLTALGASFLTLFSGFGLGTILVPVFTIFFPVDQAVAMTAIVHMANNIFKFVIVGRKSNKSVLFKFAVPAIIAAFAGAWLLTYISELPMLASYTLGQKEYQITLVKVVIGILMIGFALIELLPRFEKIEYPKKWLPLGGLISGFLGGLSGSQGPIRSAFLSKAGLTKEEFIGTGVAIAFFIDITRLSVYAVHFSNLGTGANWKLILAAILAAFIGAFLGARYMKKITLKSVQITVGVMLVVLGAFIGIGLL